MQAVNQETFLYLGDENVVYFKLIEAELLNY